MNNRLTSGLTRWQHLAVFALTVAIIISRRPDALLNPQFYYEDGFTWYADAWNLGAAHALLIPAGGYLNTLPRLVCALAILIPLKSAPLLLNWFGIVIQALPVNILLSARCSNWGPPRMRALQALVYVALPNSGEINVTITNAHWHLVVAALFVAFSNAPRTLAWKIFDVALMLLVGLTGPWALVLTPLVLVFWWIRRERWSLVIAGLLAVCALVQMFELITSGSQRKTVAVLGASFDLFFRLVAGQIFAGAIWGQNSLAWRAHMVEILVIFAAGSAVLTWGFLKLRLEIKLFIAFSAMILAAALRTPLIEGDVSQWHALAMDKGGRYWFFPMLGLVWTLLWAAAQKQQTATRMFAIVCLAVMLRAVHHDWHYFPYKDLKFGIYVKQFEAANPGTTVTIPIVPVGHFMKLAKR